MKSPAPLSPCLSLTFLRSLAALPALLALGATWLLTGCTTTTSEVASAEQAAQAQMSADQQSADALALKEGDVIKVSFPGVPSMDATLPVRADGRVTLPLVGDHAVAGKSIEALTKELLALYEPQLVSKEVQVALVSSSYTLYVTGAVLRPGKIVAERRISAFDAIMEAGGFDKARANLKAVVVVRQEEGQTKSYTLNLDQVFTGGQSAPFYLKPFDTVYVPTKFNWF
jgi:polysaccharide export outer membrane protein